MRGNLKGEAGWKVKVRKRVESFNKLRRGESGTSGWMKE
jgi:hypothetical protein